METIELKNILNEIGNSVHSMNTIAVSLALLPKDNITVPEGLDISWNPKNIHNSVIRARNFAERSTIVYVAESLFVYLNKISKNPFWAYPEINFKGKEKKAIKVYNFLIQIPNISEEMAILSELLCHWRNRTVHSSTSKASLSSKKRQTILEKKTIIYNEYHHFDTEIALKNFEEKKVTLKDASTLTTIVIKCCRAVDQHYFSGIKNIKDITEYKDVLKKKSEFKTILNQAPSLKKQRQLERLVTVSFPYLDKKILDGILTMLETENTTE